MVKAIVYTAPECPHSKRLKEFLASKNVTIDERCILDNSTILKEIIDVSKQRAVPVTVIGDEVFVGFDRRVERRLTRKIEEG